MALLKGEDWFQQSDDRERFTVITSAAVLETHSIQAVLNLI